MRIATAEIFSPVVTVTAFSSENEAVAIASGSNRGLPAGAYSRDSATASRVVGRDARFRLCTPARCGASRETGADLVFSTARTGRHLPKTHHVQCAATPPPRGGR
ncbi:aldehyde dehydrogenase family protein [Streptomyces sp. NPDC057293]|uniref:aldehyde dehydrogenase family protein n=1 Tax=unclassified Streptomyces TaxID=2593676 RepID=UPI00362AB7D3